MGRGFLDRACGRQRGGARTGRRLAALQGPLDSLTWRRAWAAYTVAHGGKSLLWTASDLLTLYVLVNWFALAPVVAGALFLCGLTISAVADFVIGLWLDRRPDDAAPLAGAGLALAAVSFPATMLLAPYGPWALLAATLLFRVAYSACDVPHNALLGRLADRPDRAKRLSRARTIGTGAAALAVTGGVAVAQTMSLIGILVTVALVSMILGTAMVPLLSRFGLESGRGAVPATRLPGLPMPFLAASVIGVVALAALGKAILHLSDEARSLTEPAMLGLLIVGRTLSAFMPFRLASAGTGLALLAAAYALSAAVPVLFLFSTGPVAALLLGFAMGFTNLVGWALLPMLADGPRAYGIYAMASKLALGAAGLALAGGLGRAPAFVPSALPPFAIAIAAGCLLAALLALLPLTSRPGQDLHGK